MNALACALLVEICRGACSARRQVEAKLPFKNRGSTGDEGTSLVA